VARRVIDSPLSTLTFNAKILTELLENKRLEINKNNGWCYLEPGYAGSYGSHLRKLQLGADCRLPIVHINMNNTPNNHHLTNHYATFDNVSKSGFDQWPGDLSYLFL